MYLFIHVFIYVFIYVFISEILEFMNLRIY